MRILVTRPEPDAARFAAQLAEHGIEAVAAPLMAIEPMAAPLPPLAGVQALVFTSANGVRAYAAREPRRDLPVYAVGDATAAAARQAGYRDVVSAGGDAAGLAALLAGRVDPAKGPLLHPAGADRAGDLAAALRPHGFDLAPAVVYRAAPVAELPAAARAALASGTLAGVALFSPRSAEIFAGRAAAGGFAARLADLDAYCLSPAVAAALAGGAAWRAVRVAASPNAEALVDLIRAAATRDRKPMNDEVESTASEAERIIAAFGGIRPMAKALGIAVTTVQGWKERGAIPLRRMAEIREQAERAGIDLGAETAEPATAPPDRESDPEPGAGRDAAAAERVSAGPEPGLRAAEALPPPPPTVEAPPAGGTSGRWRWAAFGAGFGAAFAAGAVAAALLGIGGRGAGEGERQAALDRLQTRINNVTAQLEDQQKRQQADAAALQSRLNRIEQIERAIGEQRERVAGLAASAAAAASRIERLDADLKALAARTPAGAGEIKGLKEQIDALAKRIEALPKEAPDPAALAALAAQTKQAADRIAALERRVGELADSRPANEGAIKAELDRQAAESRAAAQKLAGETELLRKDLAALQGRVGSLADDVRRAGSAGNETGALIVALGQLRSAAAAGSPYRAAYDAARALAKDRKALEPALAALGARADRGVPTAAQLRARFDRLAVAVLRAAAAPAADADMWERIWARLQTLVTVRRIGEAAGDTPAARLSRAEAALARGDLDAAVKQMEALAGPARAAAAGWLADAEARRVTDAALAELDRAALGLLRPADPPPPAKTRP